MITSPRHADDHARVEHNLRTHPPVAEQVERIEAVREAAIALGHVIADQCPQSREASLALTDLESTVMWAVAAIARAIPQEDS